MTYLPTLTALEGFRPAPDGYNAWFPDEEEVRLVEVTEQIPVSSKSEVMPFYFPPAPYLA